MRNRFILAIDPGKKGAFALYDIEYNNLSEIVDMPLIGKDYDYATILEYIKNKNIKFAILEKQQPIFKVGKKQVGVIMEHYGELKGILRTLDISYEIMQSKKWKNEFGLIFPKNRNMTKKEIKAKSIKKAQELFPNFRNIFTKSKDGRAEAALMALYAYRNLIKKM